MKSIIAEINAKESLISELAATQARAAHIEQTLRELIAFIPVGFDRALDRKAAAALASLATLAH